MAILINNKPVKILLVLILSLALVLAVSSGSEPKQQPLHEDKQENATTGANTDAEAAIKEIRDEKTVLDIYYDPGAPVQWHIGVLDDGSKRYGFASYICEILLGHGLVYPNTYVRIVDIQKVSQGETFRKASLGKVNCSTYENSSP